ncbi:MAG: methyltransferase domain-containing protein, partial [Chitinophagaceae bacterium]
MKINTDGTLLAVLSEKRNTTSILDIGTGTGVVALMLAQRYPDALVDAVEIDKSAADTAQKNFTNSVFSSRLTLYPASFQDFSVNQPLKKYDLIVSNPPFFINSLKNPDQQKQTARHTDSQFFEELVNFAFKHLQPEGIFTLILPPETGDSVKQFALKKGLFLNQVTNIRSFEHSET